MMNKFSKTLVTLVLIALGGSLFAQAPAGYYSNATGKTGDELKTALHEIIKGHTSISYSNIWNAFWTTDNKGNNVVWDMYSDGATYSYSYVNGDDQCGEYVQEGDCYNREHSWPQSWFSGNDQAVPSRDLHHIFPTDGFVNAQRGSYPFGEVNNATWTSQNGSKLGVCNSSLGYTGTVFEPIDEYKGDFARAMMYMSVRYYTEDEEWGSSGMTDKSVIKPWAIAMLMDWSDNDPVSQKEIDRNNAVFDIQGNRNPFIDFPEYARMIWDSNWHESIGGYVKVTSSEDITDGDYLIVYEGGSLAFDGSLNTLDAIGNTIEVSIFGDNIESNSTTDASAFTIAAKTGGYSIKSASGYYIGNTSDANALKTSQTDAYVNTITILENGNADIVCSSSHLRYNPANGQARFRYYKSGTYTNQQAIQLYKKIAVYSINLAFVEHGNISADAEEAVEGTTISLTAMPEEGYDLDHWTVTDAQNNAIEVTNNQFVMPASDVVVSAVFVYVGVPFVQKYHLVTSANQLVAGRKYLIVNTSAGKAMGASSSNGNNRTAVDVIITDNVIESLGSACELTLGSEGSYWTLFDANWNTTGGYLYAASSSSNYLKTQATFDDNGKWAISIASNGVATVQAQGNNSRNIIRYNSGSTLFSCYSTGQQDVCLFIRSEEFDHTESETIADLFPFDNHTVRSGATLTVSSTTVCNDASHLVIEDGAQFAHQGENVMATVKKTISAYTSTSGWYTIAVPFASYTPTGTMISDNYDLYFYKEAGPLEWVNFKPDGNFALASGMGYLYAHNPSLTLRMTGTLNSGDYTQTVNLGYTNTDTNLIGFNLLGNPTAHEISFSKTNNVSDGYYYLNNSENWIYETGNTVPVGRGFLVKANAEGQTVTLNPQTRSADETETSPYLCINMDEHKAYVKLGEGTSMPLLNLKGQYAPFYLTRDGKPYVMLVRDGATALDLCYEARQAGTHTLTVATKDLGLDYLHLIDHLTGADIDLLATTNYSFESMVTDYANRFRLVFAPGSLDENGDDTFAFVSNGEIVLTDTVETQNVASLQIIDMTGRVVCCKDAKSCVSTKGMKSGVYILRLITTDAVRLQKLVIE